MGDDDFMEIGDTYLIPIGDGKFKNALDGTIIDFVEDEDDEEATEED